MAKARAEKVTEIDPRVVKLMAALRETCEKQNAIMLEIDALLAGKAGIGDKLKSFYEAWGDLWSAKYHGRSYVFAFAKDAAHLKRLLRTITLDELVTRAGNYMRSDDPFVVQSGHSFNVFVAMVNQFAGFISTNGADAPVGCKHDPACKDDAACTKRKHREMLDGK